MKKQRLTSIALAGLLCLVSGGAFQVAWAQSTSSVQQLKQEVESLKTSNENNNRQVAKAINLLNQMQGEFQSIRGQVEASKFLTKETDRVYQDLDMRVSALEDKIDQIHGLLKELTAPAPLSGEKPSDANQEYQEYQALLDILNARNYREAASGFLGFLRKYPKSKYAGNARYWVAESYYSMGDFAKAIKEYQKLVEEYPDNPRVKEAIYRQGLSFMRLKKNEEAKLFFQKVMAAYPNSAEAAKAQSRLHRIKELEEKQLALGESTDGTQKNSDKEEDVVYRPIMKPVPQAGSPMDPKATPSPAVDKDSTPQDPSAPDRSSVPLF